MTPTAVAALGGAGVGLGLAVLVRELVPARPQLASSLARLDAGRARSTAAQAADVIHPAGLDARVGRWLAGRLADPTHPLAVPAADLAVVGRSAQDLCACKAAWAAAGLVGPVVLTGLAAVVGVLLPVPVPVVVSLVAAVALFFAPDLRVRQDAARGRADFRRAVGAYLDLVALERAADGGPAEALERAAAVGHGWAFTRIADRLERARLAGRPPWEALGDLADELGVEELRDLAEIVGLAGDDGAAVYETLVAKAAALRTRTMSETEAAANAASERMTLPGVLLGFAFTILVSYPGLARVLG